MQRQPGDMLAEEPVGQHLRHRRPQTDAHQRNLAQLQPLEGVEQRVGMPPDARIRRPGMGRLPIAEHIEGIDGVSRRRQRGITPSQANAPPGRSCSSTIAPRGPRRLIRDDVAQVVVDAARRAALRGYRRGAGLRWGRAGGGSRCGCGAGGGVAAG